MTRAADLVQREAGVLASLLGVGVLDAPVPGCPGWSLVDLARHTGGVHRWATAALTTPPGGDPGGEPTGPGGDEAVRRWFADGAEALAGALRSTAADAPCWTFATPEAPATTAFWARRQVLETALHRWDAEVAVAAAGLRAAPDPGTWLEDDVAAAGLAEVADVLLPRQVRLGRTPAPTTSVALEHGAGRATLLGFPGGAGGPADAVVVGPSPVLLLLLWRRTTLAQEVDAGRLAVRGDRRAAEHVLSSPLTP